MKKVSNKNVLFPGLILCFLIFGCSNNDYSTNNGGNGNNTPAANEVWMQNTLFNPKSKTVNKGTEITWINKDSFDHTVTSGTPNNPDGLFDSGTIGSGGTFKRTFDSAGTFNYYCKIHQDVMTGTITVQ